MQVVVGFMLYSVPGLGSGGSKKEFQNILYAASVILDFSLKDTAVMRCRGYTVTTTVLVK